MTPTIIFCCFLKISLKNYRDQIIEISNQSKSRDPECHEAMANANIDIFEISDEKLVF
jgi:hypothetical protein